MISRMRRTVACGCVMLGTIAPNIFSAGPTSCVNSVKRSSPPIVLANQNFASQLAGLSPEVRLRKLHLVRPDLIPYPIEYEVYC